MDSQPPQDPSTQQAQSAEQILYQGIRRHSASWWDYSKWVLVIAFGTTAGSFLMKVEFFSTFPVWLVGAIGFPGILYAYLKHITTKYKISNRRVEVERGVISKDVDSLELWRVLDVRYKQGVVDRILGNATITLIGTDQSDPELDLHGMPDHRKLFESLRDAVQTARTRGRPIEMVGDGLADHMHM